MPVSKETSCAHVWTVCTCISDSLHTSLGMRLVYSSTYTLGGWSFYFQSQHYIPHWSTLTDVLTYSTNLKHLRHLAHLSANTTLVFVTFSMVNFVLPPVPAILPMALERWSPFSGFTVGRWKRIPRVTKGSGRWEGGRRGGKRGGKEGRKEGKGGALQITMHLTFFNHKVVSSKRGSHVPYKSGTMPNKSETTLGAYIPADNNSYQKNRLELSMTYELSLFCCIIYHVTNYYSSYKNSLIIEDNRYFLMAEWTLQI